MTRSLVIDPAALADAHATAAWYEERRPGHGARFRSNLDFTFEQIAKHPELYQQMDHRFRRAFVRQFRCVVVYRVTPDAIQIIGVMPTRADPTEMALLAKLRTA